MIHPKHYQELLESAIAPELIEENFYSVEGSTELFYDLFPEPEEGYPKTNTGQLTAGLLRLKNRCEGSAGWRLDPIDPITGEKLNYFRFKPDAGSPLAPKWNTDKGKLVGPKYWSPKGSTARAIFLRVPMNIIEKVQERYPQLARFYITPENFWQKIIEDPSIPIAIGEGEKKAGSLLSQGIVAIGVTGINMGYRKTLLGRELIPDLKLFAQPGRGFTFYFDSDIKPKTRENTEKAISITARLLLKERCKVNVVTIPLIDGAKGAIDDYLYKFGAAKFEELKPQSFIEWEFNVNQKYRIPISPNLIVNTASMGKAIDVSFLPKMGILMLDGAKGTGKTELLEKICNVDDIAVLSLGHRIFLQRGLAKLLNLDYRSDLETVKHNGIKNIIGSASSDLTRLSGCSEGLLFFYKIIKENFLESSKRKILVLDEADQLLISLLTSSTCNKDGIRPVLLSMYEEIIRNSDLIVLASADISMAELNWVLAIKDAGNLTKTPVFYIKNEYVNPGYKAIFVNSKEEIVELAKREIILGNNIWIATDNKEFSIEINSILSELINGDERGLLINSNTSDQQEQKDFIEAIVQNDTEEDTKFQERVKAYLKPYRFIIATQSLWTSASITVEHFSKVFGCYCSGNSPDWDISQSLERYRIPVDRIIYCTEKGEISPVFPFYYESHVREKLRLSTEINVKVISYQITIPITPMTDYQWNWDNSPHIKLFCHYVAQTNRSVTNLRENLESRLRYEGKTVEHCSFVDVEVLEKRKIEAKEAKKANKEAQTETFLFKTKRVSSEDAKKIDYKPKKSTEEVQESNHYHFERFYGLEGSFNVLEELEQKKQELTSKLEKELEQKKQELTSKLEKELKQPTESELTQKLKEELEQVQQETEQTQKIIIEVEQETEQTQKYIRDTYKIDRNGQFRGKIRTLEYILNDNGLIGAISSDIKSWNRQAEHGKGIFAPDLSHRASKVWAYIEVLHIKQYLDPDKVWNRDSLAPLVEIVQKKFKPQEFQAVFGFSLPAKLEGKTGPLWLFSKLMDSIGIKTQRKRKGRKQAPSISIDREHWEWVQHLLTQRNIEFFVDFEVNVVMSPINKQITEDITTSSEIPNNDPIVTPGDEQTFSEPLFEKLGGTILVEAKTGRPDIVTKQTHFTQWETVKKAYVSRNDLKTKAYRLPTVEDVVGWIREAISTGNQKQATWLFKNFSGDGNCLMAKAIERFPEELVNIYDFD